MNTILHLTTITLCTVLHTIAHDIPLAVSIPGDGYTRTSTQTYTSATVNISGNGVADLSSSTIKGLVKINISGTGRVILNHSNQLDVTIGGIGDVYNLKKSSHLTTKIGGSGSLRENTWYPAWYLRNPLIGYVVVPIIAVILIYQGWKFISPASNKKPT